MINHDRLAGEFAELAAIASPPRKEAAIARYLAERLQRLGGEVCFDQSEAATGGEVGNLVARFPATGRDTTPLLFSVHMDTVEPCAGVMPILKEGIFESAGDTVLGADDKAGIAELIEALEVMREQQIPRGSIEVVVTVAEEVGLVGAKNFDFSLIRSRYGFALDTPGVDVMVLQAPAANRIKVELLGRESHAGVAPEAGVSAIHTAALALARMRLGRIDHETTANFGKVEGGVACNIIAGSVFLEGEARSHDPAKLRQQTDHMRSCFEAAAAELRQEIDGEVRPRVRFDVQPDYPAMAVSETAQVVQLARTAAAAVDHPLTVKIGGGGSDANIFNEQGLEMIILGTGMQQVHSCQEKVAVADMAHVAELLVSIMRQTG
ncbi:MAG TPA: M20/M25/M40 family metallo-hydrolase [Desulfuromonadales bacterium]|nr:M20/M25/M40 family metallo-hydrolase [Desulfuromonadales bacterium]